MVATVELARMLGVGLYTIPEGAALTRVRAAQISRWAFGYTYRRDQWLVERPPVWQADLPEIDGRHALSFRDLMETRFVAAFRRAGVSLHVIRLAAAKACELFETNHPFSVRRFRTDGRRVFAEIADDAETEAERLRLLDLVKNQYTFREIIVPGLLESLDYEGGIAARWYPDFPRRQIVLDPARAFGRPILEKFGIPTGALMASYEVEKSIGMVARYFEVPPAAVRSAVQFEQRLASESAA